MYELLLNDEIVDRIDSTNLEQAEMFFVQRKQMTLEQFKQCGYSVRKETPKQK